MGTDGTSRFWMMPSEGDGAGGAEEPDEHAATPVPAIAKATNPANDRSRERRRRDSTPERIGSQHGDVSSGAP
jgi:hypothetical protein